MDRRRLKRWRIAYLLRVFNGDSDSFLGHVADISSEGLCLISDGPLPTGIEMRLSMLIPREGQERARLAMRAVGQWSKPDANPFVHLTGFQINEIAAEDLAHIQRLTEEFGE